MIIWLPTQKHLKMQRCYKFKSKVFLSAFKILDYSPNVSFHPYLLPVPKILHSCWILFWICTFFRAVLSIRNVSPTHWNSTSSSKTIPITIYSIKSFWLISNFIFLFFETSQHFLVLLWHLLQSTSKKCVYYLPSPPPNRWNPKLPIERKKSHSFLYTLYH